MSHTPRDPNPSMPGHDYPGVRNASVNTEGDLPIKQVHALTRRRIIQPSASPFTHAGPSRPRIHPTRINRLDTVPAEGPEPHTLLSSSIPSLSLTSHLALSTYSADGFSYLAQKKRALFLESQVLNLLSSAFKRVTDSTSMFVWAMISGRLTVQHRGSRLVLRECGT